MMGSSVRGMIGLVSFARPARGDEQDVGQGVCRTARASSPQKERRCVRCRQFDRAQGEAQAIAAG
jgi:hypothetical protein